jgi:outer membrane cobalamin receptor
VTAQGDVLTRAQIDRIKAARMTDLFENRFAGVQVTSIGGQPTLVVRGHPDPLVVIDGVPQGISQSSLWSLEPRDIEQIQILENAATIPHGPRSPWRRGRHDSDQQ